VGACAISGLPPLNGFVSEFLIYLGVLMGVADQSRAMGVSWALLCVLVMGGLALIGGLAAACFTKAFGCVFLGEPRSDHAKQAHEVGLAMRASMLVLAGACFVVALTGPIWPYVYRSAIVSLFPDGFRASAQAAVESVWRPLVVVCISSWVLLALLGVLARIRRRLLSGRRAELVPTWDCGYVAPTPRMQYSASSFASPLLLLFRMFLKPHIHLQPPIGLFPNQASYESETPDVFREYLFRPVLAAITWAALKLRWVQQGRIQVYVLYIALTILVLLIWKLG